MPLTVLSALATAHVVVDQPYTAKFFALSHFNLVSQLYNKGPGDWPFVLTWVLFFTLLRASLMRYVFRPLFYHFAPHPTTRTATRFEEQAWSVLAYSISFLSGLYIVLRSPYWGDTREMWAGYPQIENDAVFKAYYLIEIAFWFQQVFVLNIEARRKDFWQMFAHHLITCTLMFMSYTYNVTAVGNVILSVMDFSDILLSVPSLWSHKKLIEVCETAEISRITTSMRCSFHILPHFMAIHPTLPFQPPRPFRLL
jgi:very-long-chain ceramide synthase